MLRADLHVHTKCSGDCGMSFEEILRAAASRGVNCLAITDHNTIRGAVEMQRTAPIRIIVGEEIRTLDGEITGLFLQEEIPRGLAAQETVKRIKGQGGLVYIPHPFDRLRRSRLHTGTLLQIVRSVDVVEVFNSRNTFRRDNIRADDFARRFGLARGGGSDAHVPYEIGQTVVEIPEFGSSSEFLQALAHGTILGRRSSPLVHFASAWNKLRRKYMSAR